MLKVRCKHIFIFLLSTLYLQGCHMNKGFRSYQRYDFYTAKKHFEKLKDKKKKSALGHYGLAELYFKVNTPLFDPDSAYHHIKESKKKWSLLKDRHEEKLCELTGTDSMDMIRLKDDVHHYFYIEAREIDQVEAYQKFIDEHPDAEERKHAVIFRDQLAYQKALEVNTSNAMLQFIEKYPKTHLMDDAVEDYQLLIYKEQTKNGEIQEFKKFIKNYPGNPHVVDAQDKIYELYFTHHSLAEYEAFINQFPNNINIPDAWRKLLDLFLVDYSAEQIAAFSNQYPNYPFQEELMESYQLANMLFFPFEKNGLWGFKDKNNQTKIAPSFNWVEPFKNGISMVGKDGKYFYIDKKGKILNSNGFDDGFSFSEALAIVELNNKMGAINRVGKVVIPIEYDDLSNENEGFVVAEKDNNYFYLDDSGNRVFENSFDFADNFNQGKAMVGSQNKKGMIDTQGNFLITPEYESIKSFYGPFYSMEKEGVWGILHLNGDTLLSFLYDYIGDLSENRCVVFKEGNYGFIDSLGNVVIEVERESQVISKELLNYKNHHVPFEVKGKIGLMDTLGNKKISAIFQNIGHYDGLIPIIKNDLWGYCDTNTDLQIKYQYDWAENFRDTLAIVNMNGLFGMINQEGIFHIAPIFKSIEYISPEILWMVNDSGGRFYDLLGEPLFERFFTRVEQFSGHWYQLVDDDRNLIYYHLKDRKFLSTKEN